MTRNQLLMGKLNWIDRWVSMSVLFCLTYHFFLGVLSFVAVDVSSATPYSGNPLREFQAQGYLFR
jgi:hypothetical protein